MLNAGAEMAKKDWTIVQVPYGGGYSSLNLANTPNVRRAPGALKKEFMRQKIFMADNGVSSWDNILWQEILVSGYKNNMAGWKKIREIVANQSYDIYKRTNKKILFLGGSHSITASTYCGLAEFYWPSRAGLIVLDAHPDCCYKADWPIHSDWLRWLVEKKYVLPENILIIGLRQIEKSEKEFLDRFDNIRCYSMSSLKHVSDFKMNDLSSFFTLEKFRKLAEMYISIDIDVASGAYAPGTGCPSPGGFTDTELISLVKQLKIALPNLRAADIVEINPLKWWQKKVLRYDITVDLGVKLIKEIIS